MSLLPYGIVLFTTLATADPLPPHPTLDELATEAAAQRSRHPERWARYQRQAERVFAENARATAHWMSHLPPPRPDLTPLRLPLAFLADALRQEEHPNARALRHDAYLRAIVHSADERRIPALLEYRDRDLTLRPAGAYHPAWGRLIAEAATLKWAAVRIPQLVKHNPRLEFSRRGDDILYCLIDRFARELPPDVAKVAYNYLRQQAPHRLAGYDNEQLWDVLFRLDGDRARKDVLPYFSRPAGRLPYNAYVIALLFRHAGPSPEVAAAVRRWLGTVKELNEFSKRQLRVVLLRSDPATELAPTVRYIDGLLAEQQRKHARFEFGGDVHYLVLAMCDVHTSAADDRLARYTFERAMDGGIRFLLLEALVKHHYPKASALAARWLAEEPEHMQRHLKKEAAEKWGPYGREVLREAERQSGPALKATPPRAPRTTPPRAPASAPCPPSPGRCP